MTTALTLRQTKGSLLTHAEVDANFTALRDRADATRKLLSAPLDLYVRTDGSDSNNGLANTAGGAFATIQAAITASKAFDTSQAAVTINVGAGTYGGSIVLSGVPAGVPYDVRLLGDAATPANVVLTGAVAFYSGNYLISGFRTTNGFGVTAGRAAYVNCEDCIIHGGGVSAVYGGQMDFHDSELSGSTSAALKAYDVGILQAWALALTGTPAYSSAFALATELGMIFFFDQPAGAATGKRYDVTLNGVINTFGGGASYLPGDSAGVTATGGQYA